MTEKERKSYDIAKNHLGSLFTLYKTAGFIQWKKKQDSFTRDESHQVSFVFAFVYSYGSILL
jgi:hypothetical protein